MKEAALKEAETKKIILGTYAMASEGLDIKTLTTLFMVTPKSDICQSVGRILRSKEHKPLVVDFGDDQESIDIFRSWDGYLMVCPDFGEDLDDF
jgi:superfamily II DNA or RNA helicase